MTIQTLLVYDKPMALANLHDLLSFFSEFAVRETCNASESALLFCEEHEVDVVFIDLEMSKGLELVAAIREVKPNIIIVFVSDYSDYAVKAFELNAQDYLVKPITKKRIAITAEKLNYLIRLRQTVKSSATLTDSDLIPGKNNGRIYLLKVQDILYFTTIGRNVFAAVANGRYKLQGSLSYWEGRLPGEKFIRCHNSYIVNLSKIEYIAPFFKNAYSIKITGSTETVPVSRTFAKGLKERVRLLA
ncbi:Transcriptional regulatory protein YpdB [Sporomusa ovata DSM 2662]|uniref:Two-component system response regulator protein n=1 Tax=Sporomusa ovata TaxID=2378 RepID=A0A0U1L0P1_9FIRM|nr:LytTR family DNA-binding domain-containing protein [Sporomusa ovata]EQB27405.1 response regulator of the LytR/AlgR family [Sporomusa ovata DSM 2662]CQR73248.1 Two-component system response regulator protein [Sporomusa ovata]